MTGFRRKLVTPANLQVACCAVAFLCVALWASNARAYPSYDDGAGNGCVQCHPGFQGGNSLLHNNHENHFGISFPDGCNLCHPNGFGTTPVLTYESDNGNGLGCAGCHGRDYGETSSTSGNPKATGYGLRQYHVNNSVPGCPGCHVPGNLGHPNPLPPILDENVAPPYYGLATNNLTNPCDSAQEDMLFDIDSVGLDNDGDGQPDWPNDPACLMPTTTTTTTSTTTTTLPVVCGVAPAGGCVGPEKGILVVKEDAPGKEKVKVVIKKLKPAVDSGQFGNPVSGTTSYAICIYDDVDGLVGQMAVARAGQDCGTPPRPCWKAISDKGYKYRDKDTSADGILKIITKGGDPGRGKVIILGKNNSSKGQLSLPTGIAAALLANTKATVQVLTGDADCFGVTTADVKKADGSLFKALGGSPSAAFLDDVIMSALD